MTKLRCMQGAVKAIQRDMQISDDTWPVFLHRITGKHSSTKLNFAECKSVFDEAERMGWKSPAKQAKALYKACNFLWLQLKDAGKLENSNKAAFRAFVKKFTGKREPENGTRSQLNKTLEALKAWCIREGVSIGRIGVK